MNILSALLLAAAASAAEPATLTLTRLGGGVKPILYYNAAKTSRDLSLMAAVGEQAIGVWHLPDGRQLARVPLPDVPREKDDLLEFRVLDVSQDGRSLLVSQARRLSGWERGEYALYLLTLDDKRYRTLLKGRQGCHHVGEPGGPMSGMMDCPRVDSASFSPDGKLVYAHTWGYASDDLAYSVGQPLLGAALVSSDGRVVKEWTGRLRMTDKGDPVRGTGPRYAPVPAGLASTAFAPDGRLLGLVVDDTACEIVDVLSGKSAAFLESCTEKSGYLFFDEDGRVFAEAYERNTPLKNVTYWDAAGGRRLAQAKLSGVAQTAWGGGRLFIHGGEPPRFEVREGAATAPVAVSSGAPDTLRYQFDVRAMRASADGTTLFIDEGSAFETFRVDFPGAVAAAPAADAAAPPAAKLDVDAAPATAAKSDPDSYAVVVGVERYRQAGIPAVDYAARDAKTMAAYLTGAMGFDAKNVVLLTDERASKTDLEKHLGTWLKNRVGPKSRVFVYYAGHGAPNPATGAGYLMPYEADPSYLDDTAYPLAKLYASLDALPTKDVTVVLDACFSGQGPRSLIAKGARPLVNAVVQKGPKRAAVIAAAASNQISLSDPEARHGLLTYYLLEGLHGAADADGDGKITPEEAFDYAKPAVERAARLQNQEQTPTASESLKADVRPWVTLKK